MMRDNSILVRFLAANLDLAQHVFQAQGVSTGCPSEGSSRCDVFGYHTNGFRGIVVFANHAVQMLSPDERLVQVTIGKIKTLLKAGGFVGWIGLRCFLDGRKVRVYEVCDGIPSFIEDVLDVVYDPGNGTLGVEYKVNEDEDVTVIPLVSAEPFRFLEDARLISRGAAWHSEIGSGSKRSSSDGRSLIVNAS